MAVSYTHLDVYKRQHQKHYLNTINESLFMFIQYVIQMAVLLTTYNYVLYLIVQIGCVFCSNLLISRKVDKMYPYLKRYKGARLDGETRSMMKTNIVSMMFHRIGSVAVTGTDNIIIAQISMAVLGLYSNYTLIVGTIRTVLSQVFNAVTASVGNLSLIHIYISTYPSPDHGEMAAVMKRLMDASEEELTCRGKRGREFVLREKNEAKQAQKLIELLKRS